MIIASNRIFLRDWKDEDVEDLVDGLKTLM
jgi:hypothetical protein